MTERRYAQDTKLPVEKSQADLRALFKKAGADQIAMFEGSEKSSIAFALKGRMYRLTVGGFKGPQDERRLRRLLVLLVKAKLEAVREGASTIEREFLSDTVLWGGQTVAEALTPQIEQHYRDGGPVQLQLMGPRPGG